VVSFVRERECLWGISLDPRLAVQGYRESRTNCIFFDYLLTLRDAIEPESFILTIKLVDLRREANASSVALRRLWRSIFLAR